MNTSRSIFRRVSVFAAVFLFTAVSLNAGAEQQKSHEKSELHCPWQTPGELLFSKDYRQSIKSLSQEEVVEDLLCLKELMSHYYAAQLYYPDIKISSNIDSVINDALEMPNTELIQKIFHLTDGIYDLHLRYKLKKTLLMSQSKSTKIVQVTPEYSTESMHNAEGATYFKPENLLGLLTSEQEKFIRFVLTTNENLIVDLSGVGGGDDHFAFGLVKSLHTPKQHVPATEKLQVTSPLVWVGLLNLVRTLEYRGLEEFEEQVRQSIEGKTFKEILPFEVKKTIQTLQGERVSPYMGKVVLIIDGGCSSSCETIVEKLAPHPNVTVIGQRTSGTLHFSNGMTFLLPNSEILVSIPTLFHKMENDAPEGLGYEPDILTDTVNLNSLF